MPQGSFSYTLTLPDLHSKHELEDYPCTVEYITTSHGDIRIIGVDFDDISDEGNTALVGAIQPEQWDKLYDKALDMEVSYGNS